MASPQQLLQAKGETDSFHHATSTSKSSQPGRTWATKRLLDRSDCESLCRLAAELHNLGGCNIQTQSSSSRDPSQSEHHDNRKGNDLDSNASTEVLGEHVMDDIAAHEVERLRLESEGEVLVEVGQ